MMVIYGGGSGESVLGHNDISTKCRLCGNTSIHIIKVLYRYMHLFYLMSWVTSREYVSVCPVCNHVVGLDKAIVKEKYPKDTVPFIRKKGWLLCIGLFVAFFAFAAYSSAKEFEETERIAASPMVNDIYLTNLAKVINSGYDTKKSGDSKNAQAFGLMKLVKAEGDALYFAISAQAFTKKSGLRDALRKGDEGLAFDTEDLLVIHKEDVLWLAQKHIIFDFKR